MDGWMDGESSEHTSRVPETKIDSDPFGDNVSTEVVENGGNVVLKTVNEFR